MNSFKNCSFAYQIWLLARWKLFWIFPIVLMCFRITIAAHIHQNVSGNLESAARQPFPGKQIFQHILLTTTTFPLSRCKPIVLTGEQGHIITADFPGSSSKPLGAKHCEWIIRGVPGGWILLYFTELYLQHPAGIRVDCFDMEDEKRVNVTCLGTYNMHKIPEGAMLSTKRSFLMITLVEENATYVDAQIDVPSDLHGMNLTYQVVPSTSVLPQTTSEFSCGSYAGCSFLGRCFLDSFISSSWCQCFQGYSGVKCQFGPLCNASVNATNNPCHNGGKCFYKKPNNITCQCALFFTGDYCDTWESGVIPDCEALNCEMGCEININNQAQCRCPSGQELSSDLQKCLPMIVEPPTSSTQPPPRCKIYLTNSRGFIQTPNFPGPFQVPLMCEWIIRAGVNTETVIYFTEIYNKHPAKVQIFTYDTYTDGVGVGEQKVANVQSDLQYSGFDSDDYPDNITVSGAFVVIRFQVRSLSDTAVRIKSFFLDVYGFNLTYLVVPAGKVQQRSFCHPYNCSFTGSCKVSQDFQKSFCECVDGHFGEYCEYGPKCNLTANPPENPCLNNGKCSYNFGTDQLSCACKPGFEGPRCATRSKKPKIPECELLKCDQRCLRISSTTTTMQCSCDPGFRTVSTNSTECVDTGQRMMNVNIEFEVESTAGSSGTTNLVSKIKSLSPEVQDCVFYNSSDSNFAFKCLADRSALKQLKEMLELAKTNKLRLWDIYSKRIRSYKIASFPILDIINLSMFSPDPTVEGSELALVCLAQGSEYMKFSWFKDGVPFDPANNRGMWLTEIALDSERKSSQINIENVRRVHQGIYTCSVKDVTEMATNQSISVDILRPAELNIVPATPSIRSRSFFAVTCMAAQNASYTWKRNTELVSSLSGHHVTQVWPNGKGSQLFVESITEDTEYTCVASNPAGTKEKVVKVRVLSAAIPSCPPQKFMSVKWGRTAVDTTDEQLCPLDTIGTAKRKCNTSVLWIAPDFSDCASISVLRLKTSVEATQAGFGSRNSQNLEKLANEVYKLLVSNSLLSQSRDMNILVDLLEILFSICELMPKHQVDLRQSLAGSLNIVLGRLDTLNSSLDLIRRFPMADLEKNFSAPSGTASYVAAGSFPCQATKEIWNTDMSNTTEYVDSTRCSFFPTRSWHVSQRSQVSLDLILHRFFDPLFSSISRSYIVIRKRETESPESNRLFAYTAEMMVSDIDLLSSKCSGGISANISFEFPRINCSSTSSPLSEMNIRCVQRDFSSWTSETCQTSVSFCQEKRDLISYVNCSCSVTKNHTLFSLVIANSTIQQTTQTPPDSTFAKSYMAPLLVLSIFAVVAVPLVILFCFRRKKILACLLSVKRTCDFVIRGVDLSAGQVADGEIPLRPANRVSSGDFTSKLPVNESTALMVHAPPQNDVPRSWHTS